MTRGEMQKRWNRGRQAENKGSVIGGKESEEKVKIIQRLSRIWQQESEETGSEETKEQAKHFRPDQR